MALSEARYRWWALGVISIGGFMSILDTSIVNIAIPKMMAVFSVNAEDAQWILTAYMLTMGVLQPVTGYFCDSFGTRRMYLISLMVFTVGSLLCGMAWSNESMIVFRVIQAIGGGIIIPVTMTIVYRIFPIQERNMAIGIWGISAMVAPAVGPTLSGYLVEYWDWRLIFTINIPVGIIGYLAAALVLQETPVQRGNKFDLGGFVTSAVGLFCLLLALSKGVEEGWTSAYILSLLYIAVASLTLFVVIELNHEQPIIDLRLLTDWNFFFSSVVNFMGYGALFSTIFLFPLYFENVRDYSAMQSGILMLPSAVASGLVMPLAAALADRFGAKPVVITGIGFVIASMVPFMYLDMDTTYLTITIGMILRGIGFGLFLMTVTVLGMNSVPLAKISRASSLSNTVRQLAGSFGIAIMSTLMQNRGIYHLAHNAENINVTSIATKNTLVGMEKLLREAGTPPGAIQHMFTYLDNVWLQAGYSPGIVQHKAMAMISGLVQRQSVIFAFDDVFVVLLVACIFMVIPAVLLRSGKVKPKAVSK
nr:DHA2 family efflux MFS transporter permease subunit [Sporomusa sphaeroides]